MAYFLDVKPSKNNIKNNWCNDRNVPIYERECVMLLDCNDAINVSNELHDIGFNLFCTGPMIKKSKGKRIKLYWLNGFNYSDSDDSDLDDSICEYWDELLVFNDDERYNEMKRYHINIDRI